MAEREQVSLKAQSFFNDLWARGDPWELETSNWEHERYACLIAMLDRPRYRRVLEIGCGAGTFTRRLAGLADKVLALDVSSEAIARAKRRSRISNRLNSAPETSWSTISGTTSHGI